MARKLKKNSPKISVFNKQQKVSVDVSSLRRFLQRIARQVGLRSDCCVVLVDDQAIRKYNLQFRGKPEATDVLSFPYPQEEWEKSEPYQGDVVISVEMANRQKKRSLLEELKILSVHGVLHLLGYDHEGDEGEMKKLEVGLREQFNLR